MNIKELIESELIEQKRTLTWLSNEMGMSYAGLKLSLSKETLKVSDLKRICKILNVDICNMICDTVGIQAGDVGSIKELNNLIELNKSLKAQLKGREELIETQKLAISLLKKDQK